MTAETAANHKRLYDQYALEAKQASDLADQTKTDNARKQAVSAHLAARVHAHALGLTSEINEHDKSVSRYLNAIHGTQQPAPVVVPEPVVAKAEPKPGDALQATAVKRMVDKKELQASIKDGGYSFTDLQQNLREECSEIAELNTPPADSIGGCGSCWVADIVTPEHETGETWEAIVQAADGKLYCVEFKLGDDNSVTIEGSPKEVERTTDYDYVFEPETPETVVAKKAYHDSKPLVASRADDKLKKNYTEAADEAHDATDGIKMSHEIAAEKHRIAASHAKIADLPIHASMHAAHAAAHDANVASLEAKDAAGHRLAASSHKAASTALMASHAQIKDHEELKAHAGAMECKATHHGLMASAHEAHAAACTAGSAAPSGQTSVK